MGIACGPVVAGVVGARRFFYDVWGDAVNVASRMETTAPVGAIQVTADVRARLRDGFVLDERGEVDVKGKGVMRTWLLLDRIAPTEPEPDVLNTGTELPAEQADSRTG
jgi:adenylate cyclase